MRMIDADALHKDFVDSYKLLHRMYEKAEDEQTIKNVMAQLVCLVECTMRIKDAPTIDAAPVVHARWEMIGADNRGRGGIFECTSCNGCYPYKCKYCPNCGAKMDEKEDEK